jgi:membrane-associated phospholipid phosphatase
VTTRVRWSPLRGWIAPRGLLAGWLVVIVTAQAVVFGEVWRFFVLRRHGQVLDTIALGGNRIDSARIDSVVSTILNGLSVVSVLLATGVVAFIAFARRRTALGVISIAFIAGANLTTQLLKVHIVRPYLGVDPARIDAGNSLPSGHTTVAASVAVALVFVLPARVRGFAAVVGAGYAALVGVATMSAGWHRPSDSVAALLVVGGWAAAAGLALMIAARLAPVLGVRSAPEVGPAQSHWPTTLLLGGAGVVLLGVAMFTLIYTDQVTVPPDLLSRGRLFVAYAGSAAGIAGAASLMMSLVLATVHRVVPERAVPAPPEPALVAA